MPFGGLILTWDKAGSAAVVGLTKVSSPSTSAKTAPFILVVEDELLVRIMVSDFLREAGYHVIEACNADEAVSILNSGTRIDLVLTDVRMPGSMDGLGLLQYLQDRSPRLPVILTSGHLLPADAIARGAAHFLGKPYSLDYAVSLVELELSKAS